MLSVVLQHYQHQQQRHRLSRAPSEVHLTRSIQNRPTWHLLTNSTYDQMNAQGVSFGSSQRVDRGGQTLSCKHDVILASKRHGGAIRLQGMDE